MHTSGSLMVRRLRSVFGSTSVGWPSIRCRDPRTDRVPDREQYADYNLLGPPQGLYPNAFLPFL